MSHATHLFTLDDSSETEMHEARASCEPGVAQGMDVLKIPALCQVVGVSLRSLLDRGIGHLLSANLLNHSLNFGSSLLVAGFLQPSDLGEIKVLQAHILLFTLLANGGVSTAVLKYCSEQSNLHRSSAILTMAIRRAALTCCIALSLLVGLTFLGLTVKSLEARPHLFLYALAIPFTVLTEILGFYLQALKHFRALAVAQTINRVQSLAIIALGTWIWGPVGFIVSFVLAQAFGLIPLIGQSSGAVARVRRAPAPEGFTQFAVFSALSNGVALLGIYSDMFILDRFNIGRSVIGQYSLAGLFLLGASVVTYTIMGVLTPYFSEHGRDPHWVRHQLIVNQFRVTALSILVAVGTYVLAVILVSVVYGPAYAESMVYLRLLLVKYLLWSSQAIMAVALLGMGLAHYAFAAALCSTVICVVVSCLGLPRIGVTAVAFGQIAGAATGLAVGSVLTFRALQQAAKVTAGFSSRTCES